MTDHSTDDRGNTRACLLGFAVGVAAGAVLGLLLAPASGRDTRAGIVARGRAARARTAALIERSRAIEIARRTGVRGLLQALRGSGGPRRAVTPTVN